MKAIKIAIINFLYGLYLPIKTFAIYCYKDDLEAKQSVTEYEEKHRKEVAKKNLKINLMKEIFK